MSKAELRSMMATPVIVGVGAAIAWAGSQGGATVGVIPLFAVCAMFSFGLNWLVFLHAYLAQTERFFDLTGSITYVSVIAVALALTAELDSRSLLLAAMVVVWAARLGSFLFARIRRDGSDSRFDALKPSLPRFLMTWTLQGLWVLLTVACALAAITTVRAVPLGGFAALGTLIWIFGFTVEVIADRQKNRFRGDPINCDRFIQDGIWAWSRHPNYFGEITLWLGVAVVAFPALSGWQNATLISPVFVYLLLTRISGVPLLESRGKKKWGHEPEYQAYRERTPALFMRPPRSSR
jgi:steroid 5-alpha reductase family enzyme